MPFTVMDIFKNPIKILSRGKTDGVSQLSLNQLELLRPDDRTFINETLSQAQGWLGSSASYFSTYILNFQKKLGVKGPLFEIGVFKGKFLLLMFYLARKHSEKVYGVDIFEECDPQTTLDFAQKFFGTSEGINLTKLNSSTLTPQDALALMFEEKPRAISVDGDHRAAGVLKDLELSSKIIAEGGLLILDDVLNPYAAGVVEGVYRFLLAPDCEFVPFSYIDNKTFVCHRDYYETYFKASQQFVEDCPDLPVVQKFKKLYLNGSNWVEQDLLGVKVLIFGHDI